MVPEHTCTKCSDYMEVSGLGENIWNKASKHRRQQKEPNSSQGTLAHEQNKNHQKVKINGRWVPKLGL
ncbi:hypothetical protein KUF71_004387 [Frankliniella fusca]|uniref:Uncharacterized protein n=1 Tax=Frankliniella fusca TaxID=407009 RepID=A0AAE1H0J9_9NEOP|nr:hypothetical protein KUF71_004387 [Frankliniella fusca]